ncbi:MAG: RidA family protein [Planctomycetota bacterium]
MSLNLPARVASLGLSLPPAPAAAANYDVTVESQFRLIVSGQLPRGDDGQLIATGKVGDGVDLDTAKRCAAQCALSVLSAMNAELGGNFGRRFRRLVRVGVFVASSPGFTDQHLVADGASEIFEKVLGVLGRHARAAVGVAALPLDAPVEVEVSVELLDERYESD